MAKIFLIERSPDVFQTVRSYLKEENLPFVVFTTTGDTIMSPELPSIIILFGNDNFLDIRRDLSAVKNNPSFVRVPKILILPFNTGITEGDSRSLDVQEVFFIPVEKLKFQNLISRFLMQAPRRVFRILVSIQQEGSNIRYSGISMDFSETGMAFECVSDFPIGEKLQVSFVNPKNRKRFSLKAEAVRKTSTPTGSAVFYGVVFRQVSIEQTLDLAEFISGA